MSCVSRITCRGALLKVFALCAMLHLFTDASFAMATPTGSMLSNWNEYTRIGSQHEPTQTFAYVGSKHAIALSRNYKTVPVFMFSCIGKRINAAINFSGIEIKDISRIDLDLDNMHLGLAPWVLAGDHSSLNYQGDVQAMLHALTGHKIILVTVLGQSGKTLRASFDISHALQGTRNVLKACNP